MTDLTHSDLTGGKRRPPKSFVGQIQGQFGQAMAITSQDLVDSLLRRKGIIILSIIIGGLIAYHLAKSLPPWYTANGLLVVDTFKSNIPELETLTSDRTVEPWGGRSEARVLTSQQMVQLLVKEMSLVENADFNETLQPTMLQTFAGMSWLPPAVGGWLLGLSDPVTPRYDAEIERAIARDVGESMSAFSEERSYAIELEFKGKNPQTSADIVNTLMNLYIARQIDEKRQATLQSSHGLKQKLSELESDLTSAMANVREEEGNASLLNTPDGTIASRDLADLVKQRRTLRVERDQLAADLGQLVSAIANGALTALDADLVTPRLQGLWQDEAASRRRLSEVSIELGERHPRRVALQKELQSIRSQIRGEATGITKSLEQRIASLDNQDRQLRRQIESGQGEAAEVAKERTRLAQLQDEVEVKRDLYSRYRGFYEQTLSTLTNIELHGSDVRVASVAVPPLKPSSPGAGLLTVIGMFAGLLASSGTIVARRFLNSGVETLDQLSHITGLPGLGAIPSVATWLKPRQTLSGYVAEYPNSGVTETLRGILLRLNLSSVQEPKKVLLVTSSEPAEGKTSFCIALGRTAAQDGLRCLVVDCHFRRPSFPVQTNLQPTSSLNDFLSGALDWGQDAVIKDPVTGMDMLMSKATQSEMREFVSSTRLRVLIAEAREHYDLVIVDSPPTLRVPDAINLADTSDAIIFLAAWRKTRRKMIQEALRRLSVAGRPVVGVILSRVRGSVPEEYVYGGYPSV
ncbi:MAG: GumC family protein [Geminicoccaceae bacterium]